MIAAILRQFYTFYDRYWAIIHAIHEGLLVRCWRQGYRLARIELILVFRNRPKTLS